MRRVNNLPIVKKNKNHVIDSRELGRAVEKLIQMAKCYRNQEQNNSEVLFRRDIWVANQ